MDGSPSAVLSVGFGSWGSVGLVITLGYGTGAAFTLVGQWSNVIVCHSLNERIDAISTNQRIESHSLNQRITT